MKNILITGATGQIGSELTFVLRKIYGDQRIIALGYNTKPAKDFIAPGPFHLADYRDIKKISVWDY